MGMVKTKWTSTDVRRIFKTDDRYKSRQTILNAEKNGLIPKAARISRGNSKILIRQWQTEQLPEIGKVFGFLKKPSKKNIISVYTPKGGVLKSTVTINMGRMLALNGIKVCLIGLDIQCSLTDLIYSSQTQPQPENIDEIDLIPGLYEFLHEGCSSDEVIQKTELPTLDFIPENSGLNELEKKLRDERSREFVFKKKLTSLFKKYDVILFDNGPSWNFLIENSLTASNILVSPIGCDLNSFRSSMTNFGSIEEFRKEMNIQWDYNFIVPTLLERTKLSQQIYATYLKQFQKNVVPIPITRATKGQESLMHSRSVIEHDPSSKTAQEYYELMEEIWNKSIAESSDVKTKEIILEKETA